MKVYLQMQQYDQGCQKNTAHCHSEIDKLYNYNCKYYKSK